MRKATSQSKSDEMREHAMQANAGLVNNPQFEQILRVIEQAAKAGAYSCWIDHKIELLTQKQLQEEGFDVQRHSISSWEISW